MSLASGIRLGVYEIVSALGAGGMGEVYRARDSKLNRDVALKVLPDAFALDADRLARFGREAQVLASLNHPHIAAIYGFEESGGVRALVLELVEGPTLADRIAQGPLPIDEALPIAKQIADALEAAHEQGVIHRDLKPANIKLRPDGTVKVLDFGLAKALEPASSLSPQFTAAPTITSPAMMTGLGAILGTAAYMSPEQAKGRPADKRSDVWSFGCVLYEMLTGVRPFEGEDIADTLAFVLTKEPDWSKLPKDLPQPVDAILRRCLVKDRRKRTGDIAAVQFVLDEAAMLSSIAPGKTAGPSHGSGWRRGATLIAVLVAGIAATSAAAWEWVRLNQRAPHPVRFTIVPPPAQTVAILSPGGAGSTVDRAIAITPDGTSIVYRSGVSGVSADNTNVQLMVRPIDQLEARALSGVPAFREPALSPDGRWIAFSLAGELRKVNITGGPSIAIAKNSATLRGVTWGDDDNIVYAAGNGGVFTLFSVAAGGGEPKAVWQNDPPHADSLICMFPSMLPGSRAVLLTGFTAGSQAPDTGQIVMLDLRTRQIRVLIRGGTHAQYVDSGHIVYAAGGSLRAVPFDLARLQVTGDPVPVVEGVSTASTGEAEYAVSRNGTLIYVPGASSIAANTPQLSLVWVDRKGREEVIGAPPRYYVYPRVSPDGTRVALDIRDQENDIWIWDLKRQTLTRLTFDPGIDRAPVWTPDGKRVFYSSQRGGVTGGGNVFSQAADGTGTVERITTSGDPQYPNSISPDGKRLVIRDDSVKTRRDVAVVSLEGKSATQPLVQTTFNEENAEISPDGRWLAYESDESGQNQVYVRPFPNVEGGRWQISTAGGSRPLWARNGRELFYLDATNLLMAVPVQTTTSFSAGNPAKVFDTRYLTPNNGRTYDVSPDGQRFLMVKGTTSNASSSTSSPSSIVVVLNWFEELKQRVPAK